MPRLASGKLVHGEQPPLLIWKKRLTAFGLGVSASYLVIIWRQTNRMCRSRDAIALVLDVFFVLKASTLTRIRELFASPVQTVP